MIKSSNFTKSFQRAAGAVNAVAESKVNGLMRATESLCKKDE